MVLLLHIIVALTSIIYAMYLYIAPTKTKFRLSYILVALTLASGAYLAVLNPSHMARASITGLIYISIVICAIASARSKFRRRVETAKE